MLRRGIIVMRGNIVSKNCGNAIVHSVDEEDKTPYNLESIENGDLALVELKPASNGKIYPHCRLHGAMVKVDALGTWRCVATYATYIDSERKKRFRENNCRAGCYCPKEGATVSKYAPRYECSGCHHEVRKDYRIINHWIWCNQCLTEGKYIDKDKIETPMIDEKDETEGT